MRQKFIEPKRPNFSGSIDEMNLAVPRYELGQELQADSARRPAVDGRHREFLHVSPALGDHSHGCRPLGTNATTVADVLDIAADVDRPTIIPERRTDLVA